MPNTYEEMYNKILNKCCKFTEGEPVRNTKQIEDKYGILDANSILIITKVKLSNDAENKARRGKDDINTSDISYLCYEPKSHEMLYIDEEYLTEAKDKKAQRIAKKYCSNQLNNIFSNIYSNMNKLIPVCLFAVSLAVMFKNFFLT